MVIIEGVRPSEIHEGDVIVFVSRVRGALTAHRVIRVFYIKGKYYYLTKGDFNPRPDSPVYYGVASACEDELLGRVVIRIPLVGYLRLLLQELLPLRAGQPSRAPYAGST